MPDQTKPEEAVGPEEAYEAGNPDVGEGTPQTAPQRPPELSLVERVRLILSRRWPS